MDNGEDSWADHGGFAVVRGAARSPEVLIHRDFVPRTTYSYSPVEPTSKWIYTRNNLNTGTTYQFKSDVDCNRWIDQLMRQPKSFSDEMKYKDCLTKSMTDLCKYITENTVFEGNELDILESKSCITTEDKVHVQGGGKIGPMKRTRRLLSLMLFRDYRTLLVFVESLLYQNKHVAERILKEFDNNLHNNYRKPPKCTQCHLESRVDMSLIIDDLLSDDEAWLVLFVKVSHLDSVGPSSMLWRELINVASERNTYGYVLDIVTKAISNHGFHSDIVKMLKEDKELQRNSFICRCRGLEFDTRLSTNLRAGHLTNYDMSQDLLDNWGTTRGRLDHSPTNERTEGDCERRMRLTRSTLSPPTTRDNNFNRNNREKPFSSKSKGFAFLTTGLHKVAESQSKHEEFDGGEGNGLFRRSRKQVDSGDAVSFDPTDEHEMLLLKPAEHEHEGEADTLRKVQLPEETASSHDSGQFLEVSKTYGTDMEVLKDQISEEEVNSVSTKQRYESFDSRFHSTKSPRPDTDEYKLANLKTGLTYFSEDEHWMAPLKSTQYAEHGPASDDAEILTGADEETVPKLFDCINQSQPIVNSDLQTSEVSQRQLRHRVDSKSSRITKKHAQELIGSAHREAPEIYESLTLGTIIMLYMVLYILLAGANGYMQS